MDTDTISPELREAAGSLGDALERSRPVAAFRTAKARLDADTQARQLLDGSAEVDGTLRRRQAEGTLTKEDIDRLRALQQQAWSNPTIAAFVEAEEEVLAYLPEVNEMISDFLGWDFAQMASVPASC